MAIITVVCSGMMGSAITFPAAHNGHTIRLVGSPLDTEIIEHGKKTGEHLTLSLYRKNNDTNGTDAPFVMPGDVSFHYIDEMEACIEGADLIICGVSSFGMDWFCENVIPKLPEDIPLLSISKGMIDDEGNVVFSGVKLYVVGTAGKKVTINKLEVTAVDPATLPPLPTYEYGADLMPDSADKITPAGGIAGVEYHEDGRFTLSRDAASSIAWPSVKVAVDKEIDLAATPLLHLEVFMNKGCANGHLYYTRADGSTGSVQLSQLVSGTVNDMTADTDIYVDLAAYLGTEEVITVNYLTLSVYGNVGDSITWKSIEAAKLIPVEIPPEVSEEESTETGEENSEAESSAAECSHEELSIDIEKLGKDGMGPWGWILLAGAALTAAAVAILFFRKKR